MSDEQNNANSTPLAGVVVWFNPTEKEVENIKTYLGFLSSLYVIDNSAGDNSALLSTVGLGSDKIEYLPNLDNLGIATALNKGCRRAIEQDYEWIVTMDQDSCFDPVEMTKFINSFEIKKLEDPSIAVFTPMTYKEQPEGYAQRVITSGNLLNLNAYSKIGGFDDTLFIDEVDHDLCFKMTKNNFKIYTFGDVHMEHKLGNTKLHPYLFNRNMWVMHHAAIRKYYIIRNRLLIQDRFPEFTDDYKRENMRLIFGVVFFEDQKLLKLRYLYKGYRDYKKNRFGKIR